MDLMRFRDIDGMAIDLATTSRSKNDNRREEVGGAKRLAEGWMDAGKGEERRMETHTQPHRSESPVCRSVLRAKSDRREDRVKKTRLEEEITAKGRRAKNQGEVGW
jgi:hypothetical protein